MIAHGTVRILNVNDSASNRYYVSRVLRSAGWEVLEAKSGGEGLDIAREQRPSVVVLDIKLPDMSGLEVCRLLRADPATADVIIIQTSATFVTSEGKARGLESGADQYLTQPFEAVELVAMVKNLLRLRDKELESRERASALIEADRRKDEFLAMLAHELRNPLAAITAATTLLGGLRLDARAGRLTETIDRQTRHLARLVDDLLDVSRITRGKIQLRTQPVDFRELVRGFVEGEAATLVRQHDLKLFVADTPMWVRADPTRLEQVLSNLLSNAVKYTERGGRVAVSLTPTVRGDAKLALLKVRDAGIGIDKTNLDAVFDLFFQVDDSLARSQSGLGIGLTMVKRLVEMQGGSVTVSSDGLGTGTEFRIELPLIEAQHAAIPSRSRGNDSERFEVLLVDDNADSCELCAIALEDGGHKVTIANDGEEGVSLLLGGSYDAAILDIGLPTVDGYEIARRVRAAKLARQPVLLAVTGYGRAEDRQRSLEAGFDAHLVKPVDLHELQRLLAALVSKQDAERHAKQRSA
jgi:signal transduction histidine kinase